MSLCICLCVNTYIHAANAMLQETTPQPVRLSTCIIECMCSSPYPPSPLCETLHTLGTSISIHIHPFCIFSFAPLGNIRVSIPRRVIIHPPLLVLLCISFKFITKCDEKKKKTRLSWCSCICFCIVPLKEEFADCVCVCVDGRVSWRLGLTLFLHCQAATQANHGHL